MYLANEVVQQSKARKKDDFLLAFSPVIAEASATAYRGATNEVQQKLRRVVEVWRQRQIFDLPIQVAIETNIDDLDKSRSGKVSLLGGSFLGSSASSTAAPPELQPLLPLQAAVNKVASLKATSVSSSTSEYDKATSPNTATPTPPVHAARLSGLLRSLATAEGAVAESIKARHLLIEGLEKILDNNRTSLKSEEIQHATLSARKVEIEAKKREVEDGIMRGLAASEERQNSSHADLTTEPERPDVEELSSPSVEALTPEPEGPPSDITAQHPAEGAVAPPVSHTPPVLPIIPPTSGISGQDLISSLGMVQGVSSTYSGDTNGSSNGAGMKKRKVDDAGMGGGATGLGKVLKGEKSAATGAGEGEEGAMEGLDEDVVGMLRA